MMSFLVINTFNKHVRLSQKGSLVTLVDIHLCNLTFSVKKGLSVNPRKVYLSTRVLKHVYDKRPASEFDFILNNIVKIVKYPDLVYKNKSGKRGSYCFVKKIGNRLYLCSVEMTIYIDGDLRYTDERIDVVTFFSTDEKYLKNYELLWEWKGGNLHRSVLDADKRSSSTPQ
jgi:hypothetical protein